MGPPTVGAGGFRGIGTRTLFHVAEVLAPIFRFTLALSSGVVQPVASAPTPHVDSLLAFFFTKTDFASIVRRLRAGSILTGVVRPPLTLRGGGDLVGTLVLVDVAERPALIFALASLRSLRVGTSVARTIVGTA